MNKELEYRSRARQESEKKGKQEGEQTTDVLWSLEPLSQGMHLQERFDFAEYTVTRWQQQEHFDLAERILTRWQQQQPKHG